MKNYKLPIITNAAFISVGSFLLFSVALRFNKVGFALSMALGGIISFIISALFVTVSIKRLEKKLPLSKKQEKYFEILNALYYTPEKEVLKIALTALYDGEGKLLSKKIVREKEEIFSYISSLEIKKNEIENFVKATAKNKRTVIITAKIPDSTSFEILGDKISFISADELIIKAEKKEVKLPDGIKTKKIKTPFKKRFKTLLDKKRAKKYALYGILLLLMARITFFPLYYIIFGGIFISLALFIMMFDFVE